MLQIGIPPLFLGLGERLLMDGPKPFAGRHQKKKLECPVQNFMVFWINV